MDMKQEIVSHKCGTFLNQKKQILLRADLSRKGAMDEPICNLVQDINSCSEFVTTSSCSGRIILFCENASNRKNMCKCLFTSHDVITNEELMENIDADQGNVVLKFEPMILHVQCKSLHYAKKLHTCALESGFKNSGITLGKNLKITLAVRSSLGLEVPLTNNGLLLVSNEYVSVLVKKANEKMIENKLRADKFYKNFEQVFLKYRECSRESE